MAKAKKSVKAKKDYSTLDTTELKKTLNEARKELFSLQMKHSVGELKQPHQIRSSRKEIARISTVLSSSI